MYFPEKLTIAWIKQAYQNKELTPTMLVEEIIRRANHYVDKNIWIIKPNIDMCAKYIDKLPSDINSLPLWGIPFAIKDNIDLAGVPTTAACPEYAYVPEKNASVVQKLIECGAIPIGKTNLDQFATGLVGTRSPYGEVHNAFASERISGGSSSGSAVAVALGLCAFALGTDTAGSGRVPASLNNIIGYKPPIGAWSAKGVVPACESLDCVTVFANSIDDSKTINLYARGIDDEYPWSRRFDTPVPKMPKKVILPSGKMQFFGQWSDVYKAKWESAVKRIEAMDIEKVYIDYNIFQKAASILYDGAWVAERWAALGDFCKEKNDALFPVTKDVLESGMADDKTAKKLFDNIHELQKYKYQTQQILRDGVMIMPTNGGTFMRTEVDADPIKTNSLMGLYTNHCNLLDLAAIAVPENSTDKDLPFGITIFALSDAESLMLGMAEKFIQSEKIRLCVCGLHKKGYPLEYQLTELGAKFVKRTFTAPIYKLYRLDTVPQKPALIRSDIGRNIEVDVYEIDRIKMGEFMLRVGTPLSIGNILLDDGSTILGFLGESYAVENAEDITESMRF